MLQCSVCLGTGARLTLLPTHARRRNKALESMRQAQEEAARLTATIQVHEGPRVQPSSGRHPPSNATVMGALCAQDLAKQHEETKQRVGELHAKLSDAALSEDRAREAQEALAKASERGQTLEERLAELEGALEGANVQLALEQARVAEAKAAAASLEQERARALEEHERAMEAVKLERDAARQEVDLARQELEDAKASALPPPHAPASRRLTLTFTLGGCTRRRRGALTSVRLSRRLSGCSSHAFFTRGTLFLSAERKPYALRS